MEIELLLVRLLSLNVGDTVNKVVPIQDGEFRISDVCFHPYSSELTLCNCPISHSTQYHLCR